MCANRSEPAERHNYSRLVKPHWEPEWEPTGSINHWEGEKPTCHTQMEAILTERWSYREKITVSQHILLQLINTEFHVCLCQHSRLNINPQGAPRWITSTQRRLDQNVMSDRTKPTCPRSVVDHCTYAGALLWCSAESVNPSPCKFSLTVTWTSWGCNMSLCQLWTSGGHFTKAPLTHRLKIKMLLWARNTLGLFVFQNNAIVEIVTCC